VPPDYQGYYERDQRLAAGPHPGDPTPQDVLEKGTSFCFGTPDECIEFIETYEAIGVEEAFFLSAIGPETHEEVMNTISLFGKHVIPHFDRKEKARVAAASASGSDS
jgi:alkanesulfonate monooxygenase SsuD/methylene tetrahydromethanopterin reductase-like flavin-dependent oxidoreductase (luciferase family)